MIFNIHVSSTRERNVLPIVDYGTVERDICHHAQHDHDDGAGSAKGYVILSELRRLLAQRLASIGRRHATVPSTAMRHSGPRHTDFNIAILGQRS